MDNATMIQVELLAFCGPGKYRTVTIPSNSPTLEDVFHYGQNMFQSRNQPSISVGDVIEFVDGNKYAVAPVGFRKLNDSDYAELVEYSEASIQRRFVPNF